MASACKRTNDERRLRNVRWMDESGQPAAGVVRLVSAPVGAAETEPKSWGGGGLWCWAGALCCAAALYFQLRYGDSYVQAGDWSALMDTSGAAVWLSGFLLATSCVIQLAVLFAAHWRKRSED